MSNLSNAERETHINMTAEDRSKWAVFTDDPVMIRKLDKIAKCTGKHGEGKYYELDKAQVSLRKKRVLTEEQKEEARARGRKLQELQRR